MTGTAPGLHIPDPKEDFWGFYLHEHAQPMNRAMHHLGTSLAVLFLVLTFVLGQGMFLVYALLIGYFCAWLGHFVFEKNRPATFRFPLKSLASDWRMWLLFVTGRLGRHLDRYGLRGVDAPDAAANPS